jgi:hypothetical protein
VTPKPSPLPLPAAGIIRPLWSHRLLGAPRGLALAREKGWLLAWDDHRWLYLLNQAGVPQGQKQLDEMPTAACVADDGSAIAAVGAKGEVWWLAPDLTPRWQRSVPKAAVTAAIDPFGQYLAVSDSKGGLHIFDKHGQKFGEMDSSRPFHHLAFVPTAALLVGSSDFGLVGCVDLKGNWAWRDGLVIHVGSLAVTGTGDKVVFACFTEGLHRYNLTGAKLGRIPAAEACRLISMTFDGRQMLVSGLTPKLYLLDSVGKLVVMHPLDSLAMGLVISPLGNLAFLALQDGRVTALDLAAR